MKTPGVAANWRTRRWGYTPPQQPQRWNPGTAANSAGSANMPVIVVVARLRCQVWRARREYDNDDKDDLAVA
jgi:hypothetical protein